jgi:hypothetical protein
MEEIACLQMQAYDAESRRYEQSFKVQQARRLNEDRAEAWESMRREDQLALAQRAAAKIQQRLLEIDQQFERNVQAKLDRQLLVATNEYESRQKS